MTTTKLTMKELNDIIETEIDKVLLEEQQFKEKYNIKIHKTDGTIEDYEDSEDSIIFERNKKRKEAIDGFNSYYRSLDINQRYDITKWLKRRLLNELNLSEIEEITSRVVSAGNGLSKRKNPQLKPK